MAVDPRDIKLPAYIAVVLSSIALILACIGVGTPSWQVTYSDAPTNTIPSGSTNFYYSCSASNATCTNSKYSTDSYIHLRLASGLAIVGILFIFFGTVGTYMIAISPFDGSSNIKDIRYRDMNLGFGPLCLFIGTITMLAALAEGSKTILYNGYSANLYQTAHILAIFSLLTSAYASGRRSLLDDPTMEQPLLK
ncbi:unnamed protein product [Rotaria sp. Silwood1]|nr:unnamed protein product [Rotaria sp. Silwood1]CAF1589010.1 unnamed protein product [Rotaria sp. Silwood1]